MVAWLEIVVDLASTSDRLPYQKIWHSIKGEEFCIHKNSYCQVYPQPPLFVGFLLPFQIFPGKRKIFLRWT